MLFGLLGFIVGCFTGGCVTLFCIALVTAGADEEEQRERLRYEDDLK